LEPHRPQKRIRDRQLSVTHSRNPKPEGESDLRSRRSHSNQRSPALNRFESEDSGPWECDTTDAPIRRPYYVDRGTIRCDAGS